MLLRPFSPSDEGAVIALWRRCDLVRPWNDPHEDIQRKLKVAPELFLVGVWNGEIVATVMAGYEGHRGWSRLGYSVDTVVSLGKRLEFDDPGFDSA
ncbi:MAG: hypothetical protein JO251_06225 [Verrucomicrobia bacterium]|nr:hypothetical protein [Verrucomicrobiota bacterium]